MVRLVPQSPVHSLKPYVADTNEKREVVLLDDIIEHTIRETNVVTGADLERIYDIYKTLKQLSPKGSEVTHLQMVLRLMPPWNRSATNHTVELAPVGWYQCPGIDDASVRLQQMLTALKHWHATGYCHGKVRWRNIVYVPDRGGSGYWMLVGMDESRRSGTAVIDWDHEFRGSKLRFQHDLYQIGKLLDEISFKLPSNLQAMKEMLLSPMEGGGLTAEKAIAEL